MDPAKSSERAERLESLFDQAVDLDVESRSTFLDRVSLDDPFLRDEIESLLLAFEAHSNSVRRMFEELPLAKPGDLDEGPDPQTLQLFGQQIGPSGLFCLMWIP